MLVRDVMTPNSAWISPSLPVGDASSMMETLDLDCLPVGNDERLIGTITERDIAFSAASTVARREDLTVHDIMLAEAAYCLDSQSVDDASGLMRRRRLWNLPVFDRRERLVGTLSLEKALSLSGGRTAATAAEAGHDAKMTEEWIAQYLEFHGSGASLEMSESGEGGFLPWTVRYLELQSSRDGSVPRGNTGGMERDPMHTKRREAA